MILPTYKRMRIGNIHITVLNSHIAECSNQNSHFQRWVGKHKTPILDNFWVIPPIMTTGTFLCGKRLSSLLRKTGPHLQLHFNRFSIVSQVYLGHEKELVLPWEHNNYSSHTKLCQNLLQTSYKSCREKHGKKDLVKVPLRFSYLCLLILSL